MRAAMAEASRVVLADFELRTEAKIIIWPDGYMDPRGERMWKAVWSLIEEIEAVDVAMYEGWRKNYRSLRKQRPNMSDVWYSQQIAKADIEHGRDAETIRKHMKK
jgi:hypothetical protein